MTLFINYLKKLLLIVPQLWALQKNLLNCKHWDDQVTIYKQQLD